MDVQRVIEQAKDAITVRRVFGDPIQANDITLIPAARVQGGAGGGEGEGTEGGGRTSGSGLGVMASPAGAFVIRGGDVAWRPAIDVNRAIIGGQIVAVVALLVVRSIARARTVR